MLRLLCAMWKVICAQPQTVRVAIICEECGHRHCLERTVDQAGEISIVCHHCELLLVAAVETDQIRRGHPRDTTSGEPRH